MLELSSPDLQIVLFQPEIPANTGNIGRLCVGTGSVLHLIRPFRFLMDDKSLKRAGLDYWPDLKLQIHADLEEILKAVPRERLHFCTTKSTNSYLDTEFNRGDYFIFGPESKGLPEDLLQAYKDRCITIPMSSDIRSINLSNSVAIILYEAIRKIGLSCRQI